MIPRKKKNVLTFLSYSLVETQLDFLYPHYYSIMIHICFVIYWKHVWWHGHTGAFFSGPYPSKIISTNFMYFDDKVYFKLIMQTNYDKIVDLEDNIVSFSPFPPFFLFSLQFFQSNISPTPFLVWRLGRTCTARTALAVRPCLQS